MRKKVRRPNTTTRTTKIVSSRLRRGTPSAEKKSRTFNGNALLIHQVRPRIGAPQALGACNRLGCVNPAGENLAWPRVSPAPFLSLAWVTPRSPQSAVSLQSLTHSVRPEIRDATYAYVAFLRGHLRLHMEFDKCARFAPDLRTINTQQKVG